MQFHSFDEDYLQRLASGDAVVEHHFSSYFGELLLLKLRVRREDKEMTIEFRLGEIKETFYQVVEDSHAGEKARHIREGMLRGETNTVPVH